MRDELQTVTFRGGRMDGAVVRVSAAVAATITSRDLAITPKGLLYDRRQGNYVAGEVVELPVAQRPRPPARRRRVTWPAG